MASIEKRTTRQGARYRAKVLVRQDPKTKKIKFISKTFDRRRDAEQWAREREVAKGKNELPEPTKESLAVYARRYLDNVIKKKVRPRTYQGYSSVLRRYLEDPPEGAPLIGDLRLDRVSPEALELLYGWMQNEQGLSAGTVRSLHAVLRQVIQKAARRRRLTLNVADLVDLPTKEKREVQAMSEEELRLFLKAGEGDRFYALWHLLPTTGLRPNEALGLKWTDIDLEEGKLRVQRSLSRVIGEKWKLTPPKTKLSQRTIQLSESTIQVLKGWKVEQTKERLVAGSEWEDHGFVFSTRKGRPLDWSNVWRNFERVMAAAGLGEWAEELPKPRGRPGPRKRRKFNPKYRAYDLRHTHATLLLRKGVNPKVISERLGHWDVGFTLSTYAASMADMQEEAAQQMEAILSVVGS